MNLARNKGVVFLKKSLSYEEEKENKKTWSEKSAVFLESSWSYEEEKENKDIRDRDLWNVLLIERKYLPVIYFPTRILSTMTNFKSYIPTTIFCF